MKYVYVSDKELCDTLIEKGIKPISVIGSEEQRVWVFENSDSFNFALSDGTVSQRLRFSNQLKMQF